MCASQYRWYQLFLCMRNENSSHMHTFLHYLFTGHLTVLYKQYYASYFI
jgi:hypothetical protein